MTADDITVVTPTVGDSAGRLGILCDDLRRYTRLPFRQVICDDGTHDNAGQQQIAINVNCQYIQNPGPVYGISYNLNYALEQVTTPWVFLIEDGVRPGWCWLEVAVDWLNKVGCRRFASLPVGMGGFSSLQDWNVAMAGAFPGKDVVQVFGGDRSGFYAGGSPGWNDGLWCWPRILTDTLRACQGDTSGWHGDLLHVRRIMLEQFEELKAALGADAPVAMHKWFGRDRWPARRNCGEGRYPGPFLMINMTAWREVGRFRDGCTFFEGHLGIRMQQHGYLTVCVEGPPFVHCPSQGFSESHMARGPRHHLETDQLFRDDFGWDHMEAPNKREVINKVIDDHQRGVAATELTKIELDCPEIWRPYL